jgi:GntR family transcriptional regulator / MocR family aminotransferase
MGTDNDALIVEDDYDSEFRFDAPPLQALAGLDESGCVAYVGTFSKVLSPALRAGYLVAPPPLRQRVEHFKRLSDYHTPWPLQRALAAFVSGGHLERHIRRMRRHYGEKRQELRSALEPVSGIARLQGLEAGLHAFLALDESLVPGKIAERCRARGVIVSTVEPYQMTTNIPTENGLLLGYGGTEHRADPGWRAHPGRDDR